MVTAPNIKAGGAGNESGSVGMFPSLLNECRLMSRHAFSSGLPVPPAVIQVVTQYSDLNSARNSDRAWLLQALRRLSVAHQKLTRIVAPATPQTIAFFQRESNRGGILGFLGPVPLVRHLMLVAIVSIVAFICVSLSPDVSDGADAGDFLKTSGIVLLVNELFYLSAAGLGASFAALFVANRFVANTSFDPKYNSSYWIRFVLGLMAGLMLATTLSGSVSPSLRTFAKPSLAMLGGFSAATVYRMMARLIESLESIIRGDMRELSKLDARSMEARLSEEAAQERLRVVNGMMALKQQLSAGASAEVSHSRLDQVLQYLVPNDFDDLGEEPEPVPVGAAAE